MSQRSRRSYPNSIRFQRQPGAAVRQTAPLPAAPHRRTPPGQTMYSMRIGRGCVRIERITTWTGARSGLRCILVALAC